MSHHNTLLREILHLIPRHDFEKIVDRYQGDKYVKSFTCWNQLMVMLFAQITGCDSLRDMVTSLIGHAKEWYHLGLHSLARSTIADANSRRDWHIYRDLFDALYRRCNSLLTTEKLQFNNPLYSMDSTTIELCLSVFPWAKYRTTKGAVKMHCILDHRANIPAFITITEGRHNDVKIAKTLDIPLPPDSIIVMDRGYIDFKFLNSLHENDIFFVTRSLRNMKYTITGQHTTSPHPSLISDNTIVPTGVTSATDYPRPMRLITWLDTDKNRTFTFLTNNFTHDAPTIAAIYKAPWQIELFFKWIKQNLKIKTFLGTSQNAVQTQIWIAICYYLLLAYIKLQTKYPHNLLSLSRIIKTTIHSHLSLIDILSFNPFKSPPTHSHTSFIQLDFF